MENNTKKEAAGKPIITTIVFGIVLLILGITCNFAAYISYDAIRNSAAEVMFFFIFPGWLFIATVPTILVILKTRKLFRSNNSTVLITIFAILIVVLYLSPILIIVLTFIGLIDLWFLHDVAHCIYVPDFCELW